MKILMATMGLGIGGAETHIVELSKQLQREGHEIIIASNGGVYVEELSQAGIVHYQIPMHRRSLHTMRRSRTLLRELILAEKPDIVHAHARIPAFLCGSLAKKLDVPFVTTAHWVFSTRGILRNMTNWGSRVVAVSEDIKSYLIREYGVPAYHISTTINGIDTEKFSPDVSAQSVYDEFSLDPSHPIVSYVSRMDEDRALVARQLIEIAPQLSQQFDGIQLLIAGGGNVLDELTALANATNKSLGRTCIIMTGGRTDINRIVAAGDIFVGVSRAALEAMAGEKPVIVAGNEGYHGVFTPDKLEEATAGNFCCRGLPLSTTEQLLADVTHLLNLTQSDRDTLGTFGRQVIFQHYSVERMARDCVTMYRKVVPGHRRILLCGYYGFSNAGDDAILQSIQQELTGTADGLDINVLSQNPEQTEARYGLRALYRFNLWVVFQSLRHCDALLFGGGSLLQDHTSTRSLLYYLSIIRLAELLGKPVMLYANGIGPVRRPANRYLVRRAVERATIITLRDHSSAQELRDMGVHRDDLIVTADPVFSLPPASPMRAKELIASAGLAPDAPFVAVSVRSWNTTEAFSLELAALCDHLHETHGLSVLFLLMQPQVDLCASEQVQSHMRAPSFLLSETATPDELMAVLGQSRMCVAMRLHTIIFAARMSVPLLGLDYDPKVRSYLHELGMPSAGEVSSLRREVAIAAADELLEHYDSYRSRLTETSERMTLCAQENERHLLDMLDSAAKKNKRKY